MIDRYFSAPKTLRRLRDGLSGPYIDAFADALTREGYAPATVVRYLRAAAHLGVFLTRRRKTFGDLDAAAVRAFRRHLRRCQCPASNGGRIGHHAPFAVQRFQAYLIERGISPRPTVSDARPPIPALITEFTGWYQTHRGVAPPTLRHYARGATAMLDALGADVRTWTPRAVREFLLKAVTGGRAESTQKLITATRAFLRYLAFRGDARADLVLVQLDDPRHDTPPPRYFGYRKTRRPPRLYTPAEIDQLVAAATRLPPPGALRPQTYATLISLLAATGLRIAEALALTLTDLTPDGLLIRKTKFQKTRLVPLHDTAIAGLGEYLRHRHRRSLGGDRVFVSARGRPLAYQTVHGVFRTLVRATRLPSIGGRAPTLHGLRHSFAVRALEATPTGRSQVGHAMRALATYLGHVSIVSTYWYLEATPELLTDVALASERFVSGEPS